MAKQNEWHAIYSIDGLDMKTGENKMSNIFFSFHFFFDFLILVFSDKYAQKWDYVNWNFVVIIIL